MSAGASGGNIAGKMKPRVRVDVAFVAGADQALPLPSYQTAGAAGADVCANLDAWERLSGIELAPGARALIPTGVRLAIPAGFEVQVRARSGLALRHGIALVNAPGTIDSDYRGPLGVLVVNSRARGVYGYAWNADCAVARGTGCAGGFHAWRSGRYGARHRRIWIDGLAAGAP